MPANSADRPSGGRSYTTYRESDWGISMADDAKRAEYDGDGPFECPARKQLAGVFAAFAVVSIAIGIKVFLDLFGHETEHADAYSPAILGLLLFVGLGVGLVFAARACRGLKVGEDGIASLQVVEKDRTYAWEKVSALVYCLPRAPDAVEAFYFELEGNKRCDVPLKCSHRAARYALARNTPLKIMRYYQLTGTDFLEGDAYATAEKVLRDKLAGKKVEKADPQTNAPQPA
jgi:hypothetical protein